MKLHTLIEDETFDIFHDGKFVPHTREELISATKNNLAVDLSTSDDWFIVIITDVPPISKQKFNELMELSFQPNNLICKTGGCMYEDFFYFSLLDHSHITDPGFTQKGYVDVDIMSFGWKEFVLWINEYFQDMAGEDDFDE